MSTQGTFIQVTPGPNGTHFSANATVRVKESNGVFDCYIPGFNLFYSTSDKSKITTRGATMMKAFIKMYVDVLDNSKLFFLELHKLGFRTSNHNYTMKSLIDQNNVPAKFHSRSSIDPVMDSYNEEEMEMTVNF